MNAHHIQFPAELGDVSPLQDESWGNDSAPVMRWYTPARIVELWCDHEDPAQRELLGRDRFAFYVLETDDGETAGELMYAVTAETVCELGDVPAMARALVALVPRDELQAAFTNWLNVQILPHQCAQELLQSDEVDKYQREYLRTFIALWDAL